MQGPEVLSRKYHPASRRLELVSIDTGNTEDHSAAKPQPQRPRSRWGLQPELGIAQRYAEVREGKGLKFVGNVADTIFKVD